MDRTTLTAALKPLERRRLVKVSVDAEDKRSRRLAITAAGTHIGRQGVSAVDADPRRHRAPDTARQRG